MLSAPAPGLSLADKQADKQAVNTALLRSGAAIGEMNCIRKHLSAIKGGRLARAIWPARLVTLAISDVPGDDPSVIASGPTVPDLSTLSDARAVLDKYDLDVGPAVRAALNDPARETPKPGNPCFAGTGFTMIARPQDALEAVAALARQAGLTL